MLTWGLILIGYLLGSISFAYIAGYMLKGIDLRKHGSGNLGATNTRRELGNGPGVAVLLLDAAKGAAAVLLAMYFLPAHEQWWLPLACGLAAIAGHNWPFYLRFQGGKGVATALGVMLTLYPLPLLVALGVGLLLITVTRYVSVGSMVGAALLPVGVLLFLGGEPNFWFHFGFCLVIALLVIVNHRANIVRLKNGTEPKFSFKSKPVAGGELNDSK